MRAAGVPPLKRTLTSRFRVKVDLLSHFDMHSRISLIFYMHPTGYTATISTSVDSALKDENLLSVTRRRTTGRATHPC